MSGHERKTSGAVCRMSVNFAENMQSNEQGGMVAVKSAKGAISDAIACRSTPPPAG